MPWATTRPSGTQAKYRTPEHRAERARLKRQMDRDGHLVCQQPDPSGQLGAGCIMNSRVILPTDTWCVGHDAAGATYIGAVHKPCNDTDGAKRGNQRSRQALDGTRWAL